MKCPRCGSMFDRVDDVRTLKKQPNFNRRFRVCLNCGKRWKTIEALGSHWDIKKRKRHDKRTADGQRVS